MPSRTTLPAGVISFPDRRVRSSSDTSESEAPRLVNFASHAATSLLSHIELEDHLIQLSEMQLDAPLSFLAIELHGLTELSRSDWRRPSDVVDIVAHNVRGIVRVTDFVGRLGGSTIGVILQGSGPNQSALIAERLRLRLTHLSHAAPPVAITVSAASGRGVNALALPNAALSPLGESC